MRNPYMIRNSVFWAMLDFGECRLSQLAVLVSPTVQIPWDLEGEKNWQLAAPFSQKFPMTTWPSSIYLTWGKRFSFCWAHSSPPKLQASRKPNLHNKINDFQNLPLPVMRMNESWENMFQTNLRSPKSKNHSRESDWNLSMVNGNSFFRTMVCL